MNKKKRCYIILLLFLFFKGNSQNKVDSLRLNFKVKFNNERLELQKKYSTKNKDTIALETFKCYISSIQIHYNDNSVFTEKDSYHLLDIANPVTLQIAISAINSKIISKVIFNIGVDRTASTSGAMSGDLDPTKGMYWAWQSGYINMKMEGISSSCKTRKNEFQFHIGGYLEPYYALRTIEIPINTQILNNEINLVIDLEKFFSDIHLRAINSIMIPGKKAMELADICTKMFYLE